MRVSAARRPAATTMRRCAIRSSTSPPRSERSSRPISPTSTVPSSPWSTCRRPSKARFLPAIRAIPGPCGGSTWRSSPATRRPAAGPSTATRASARGAALRARLRRLRRRLDRPGRRRPRRLRVGLQRPHQGAAARPARRLPRAVDPLHPLRPAAARAAATATTATSELGPEFARGDGRAVRDLLALADRRSRPGRPSAGRAATRARGRLAALDPGQGARPAARPAAGGDPQPRRHLRLRPGLRAADPAADGLAAAGGARVRRR